MEGEASEQGWKRGEIGRILNDAGSGQKRKLGGTGEDKRCADS